jgi:hypothetical protein
MGYRFEFDRVNKVLLGRFVGRFTNEWAAEFYEAIRRYSTATDATVGVWDFSSVTEFAANAEFIRQLAAREPAMRDAANRPGVIAPASFLFGLSRMFQIAGETKRLLLKVVHTMDLALAALGVPDPHFEPLK